MNSPERQVHRFVVNLVARVGHHNTSLSHGLCLNRTKMNTAELFTSPEAFWQRLGLTRVGIHGGEDPPGGDENIPELSVDEIDVK